MNKPVQCLVFIVLLVISCATATAQTRLYFQDFNSTQTEWTLNATDLGAGTDTFNYWSIDNVYNGGFLGGTTPREPLSVVANPESTYMHIGNVLAGNASSLAPATALVLTKMNRGINTIGNYGNITLSFYMLCNGSAQYYGNLYYSIDSGQTWIIKTSYQGITNWTKETVTDPAFTNQADLRFAFGWYEGGGISDKDPALSIDDIAVSVNCPYTVDTRIVLPGCGAADTGSISLEVQPAGNYTFSLSNTTTTYPTQTGDSVVFNNLPTGNYVYTVSDGTCLFTDSTPILSDPFNLAPRQLCMVSFDTTSGKNLLIWYDPYRITSSQYYIYRANTPSTTFTFLDSVSAYSLREYYDNTSQPALQSYRYRINTETACGQLTGVSNYHQTVYLQDLGNGNFKWTDYLVGNTPIAGATYALYRDTTLGFNDWHLLESLSNTDTTASDPDYAHFYPVRYCIAITLPNVCDPSRSYTTIFSNIITKASTGVVNQPLENIKLVNSIAGKELKLYNVPPATTLLLIDNLGRKVVPTQTISAAGAATVDMHLLPAGIYYLVLNNKEQMKTFKVLVY